MNILFRHQDYLSDDDIIDLYYKLVDDHLLESVFYNNEFPHPLDMLAHVRDNCWLFRVECDNDIAAFAWLDSPSGKAIYIHFAVFRAYHAFSKPIAKEALQWLHDVLPDVNTLIGVIPESNTLAIRFAKAIGFEEKARIPDAIYLSGKRVVDAVLLIYRLRGNNNEC